MHPTQYEWTAKHHIDALRREAAGSQLLARARDGTAAEPRRFIVRLAVRALVDRFDRLHRRRRIDVTGPLSGSIVSKPSRANSR
jgi:hypothetical protein